MRKKRTTETNPANSCLGAILMNIGCVTKEQIDEAIKAQETNPDMILGGLLLAMGMITHAELNHALQLQNGLRSPSATERAHAEGAINRALHRSYLNHANRVIGAAEATKERVETGNFPRVKHPTTEDK